MTLQHVDILFKLIVFLFAISFHESAHAWTANRCGDPTARMLGRITLNPIKHIDPVGTVLLPLIALVTGIPVLGWAKPTPVNPHNFKSLLAYELMVINIVLGVFNLIPVPPLDGSHVLRHFLSDSLLRIYDTVGIFGLMALVYLGGGLLARLIYPVIGFFDSILMRL